MKHYYALETQTGLTPMYDYWEPDKIHVFDKKWKRDYFVERTNRLNKPFETLPIEAKNAKLYNRSFFVNHD